MRDVAGERIVRGRLIRQKVRRDAASDEFRQYVSRVAFERDRSRDAIAPPCVDLGQRLVKIGRPLVQIGRREPPVDAPPIDFDDERGGAVHGGGKRLRATHAAEAGGDHDPAAQRAAEVAARSGGESLVRTLHNALGSDVNPAAGRHLAVHRQAAILEVTEGFPGGPGGDEQRVGDEHAGRAGVRTEYGHRFAGLHQQRLVVVERAQRLHDRVERFPVARGFAGPAVHDKIVGALGDVGIEIVHEHPERGFLRPSFAGQRRAARRPDDARADRHEQLLNACESGATEKNGK